VPFKKHPADPDRVVYVKAEYYFPEKKEWVGITYEEQEELVEASHSIRDAINRTDWKLREKNSK